MWIGLGDIAAAEQHEIALLVLAQRWVIGGRAGDEGQHADAVQSRCAGRLHLQWQGREQRVEAVARLELPLGILGIIGAGYALHARAQVLAEGVLNRLRCRIKALFAAQILFAGAAPLLLKAQHECDHLGTALRIAGNQAFTQHFQGDIDQYGKRDAARGEVLALLRIGSA